MQFKGTEQFPANLLDKSISRDGGTWNAFTYMDWTAYFETMPTDKIDLALRLEADRMANSRFDPGEVASERTVITSEREGNENEPLFLLGEAIQQTAFRIHPYHHEVIGDMADLLTMQRDDLYNHYRSFYVPNNAVMAVAGDFDSQLMFSGSLLMLTNGRTAMDLAVIGAEADGIPGGVAPPTGQVRAWANCAAVA